MPDQHSNNNLSDLFDKLTNEKAKEIINKHSQHIGDIATLITKEGVLGGFTTREWSSVGKRNITIEERITNAELAHAVPKSWSVAVSVDGSYQANQVNSERSSNTRPLETELEVIEDMLNWVKEQGGDITPKNYHPIEAALGLALEKRKGSEIAKIILP